MKKPPVKSEDSPKRRPRWRRRLAIFGLIVVAGGFWLNGPGVRWIGGITLRKVLPKAGLSGDFRLEGTLLKGLGLHDVSLRGEQAPLLELDAAELSVSYRIGEVIHGQVRGIRVHSLRAVVDLDKPDTGEDEPEEDSGPLDPAAIAAKVRDGLRTAHGYVDPLDIDIRDLAVELRKGDQLMLALDPSTITHRGQSSPIDVELGQLSYASGKPIPPQEFRLEWTPEQLRIAPFDPVPDWSVNDLEVSAADDTAPLLQAAVEFEGRRLDFRLAGDAGSAELAFSGDPLRWSQLAPGFGLESPFDLALSRLAIKIDGIGKPAAEWHSDLDLAVTDLQWQDWRAKSVEILLEHRGAKAKADWKLSALDGTISGTLNTAWPDAALLLENPVPPWVTGTLEVAGLGRILAAMPEKIEIPEGDTPFPGEALTADWTLELADKKPSKGKAELTIKAAETDTAPPLKLTADWTANDGLEARLATTDVRLNATLDPKWNDYRGSLELGESAYASLRSWASAFVPKLPEGMIATAQWQGEGSIKPADHKGSLALARFFWEPPEQPAIEASTELSYRWPEIAVEIADLRATRKPFSAEIDATLADNRVNLASFKIKEDDDLLASGSGSIPLAEKPADWRGMLRLEDEWKLQLDCEEFTAEKINSFLEADKPLPIRGSFKTSLSLAGSPADPKIAVRFDATGVELTKDDSPLPTTAVTLTLDTEDGKLQASGKVSPQDYPDITIDAAAPLDHQTWIDKPDSALDAEFTAKAVVPPIDLARFAALTEAVEHLKGTINATVTVSGTPREPSLGGGASIRGLELDLRKEALLPIRNGSADIKLNDTLVELAELKFESSGGLLRGTGTLDLADPKDPGIDLRIVGTALPIWRDESIILRKDADLRLLGKLSEATLSGKISIVQSLFFRDFELIPIGPFTTPSAPSLPHLDPRASNLTGPGIPEPFSNWRLDLALQTRDPFLVRGNLAQGSVTSDVRVTGTIGAPEPRGSINIDELDAQLPLSRLKIRDGKVVFRPDAPFEPEIEIRGTSAIRPYKINVFVTGTASDPKITFTSNPPLPQNEILTLLASGATSSGLERKGAATNKAIQLLLEEARRGRIPYAKFLRPVLEVFDDIDIRIGEVDPYTGRDYNSATLQMSDRWLASLAMDDEGRSRGILIFVMRFR